MRRKPRIIHIAWVRTSCCLRGKLRRNGGRLIEFLMDRVVIFGGFIFCLGGLFVCTSDKGITGAQVLLIINNRSRSRFAQFNLRTDLLDLRGLLFYRRSERCNFFL